MAESNSGKLLNVRKNEAKKLSPLRDYCRCDISTCNNNRCSCYKKSVFCTQKCKCTLECQNNAVVTMQSRSTQTDVLYPRKLAEDSEFKQLCIQLKEKVTNLEKELTNSKEDVTNLRKELTNSKEDVTNLRKELTNSKEEVTTLKKVICEKDVEIRALNNKILELTGNFRIFIRIRPQTPKNNSKEQQKALCTIHCIDDYTIELLKSNKLNINCRNPREIKQKFTFDKVFTSNTSQADIFEELSFLVQSALQGYNVCIFAYGQTGSGKTYTLEGDSGCETEGIIPRTIRQIFEEIKPLNDHEDHIEVSFLEVYNEIITDLLDKKQKVHNIKMIDNKSKDIYISNLTIEEVKDPNEFFTFFQKAQRNRVTTAIRLNERSSRSHLVTTIRVKRTYKNEVSVSFINLVDLAGSERVAIEECATMETKCINKSLAYLSNVILAIQQKQEYIPYRNSKLTHLLMPSLGGKSKITMIINISPLEENINETISSLRFAKIVNSCTTGAVQRNRTRDAYL